MLPGKNKKTVKANTIYTEENLLTTTKRNIGNYLLHRGRLDKKSQESGGYIGYLDNEGKLKFNKTIAEHYSKNKRVVLPDLYPNRPIILPSFRELEDLARTYEVMYDTKTKEAHVRNLKTKKKVEDDRLTLKAIFANIWLISAGRVHNKEDQRKGIKKAFDKDSKRIYRKICSKINSSYTYDSYADTIGIYRELLRENDLNAADIFVKLFQSDFNTRYMHSLFYNVQTYKRGTKYPEVLYNTEYANRLVGQRGMYY